MMMAMVGRNRDEDATAAGFPMLKRKIRPGLGGDIVERPTRPRQQDELAGKFRDGKTFILTDLRYRFTLQNRRGSATNIQGGLEDLGYEIGRMRKKEGKKKEPKSRERKQKEEQILSRSGRFDLSPAHHRMHHRSRQRGHRGRDSASHRRGHYHAPQSTVQVVLSLHGRHGRYGV